MDLLISSVIIYREQLKTIEIVGRHSTSTPLVSERLSLKLITPNIGSHIIETLLRTPQLKKGLVSLRQRNLLIDYGRLCQYTKRR